MGSSSRIGRLALFAGGAALLLAGCQADPFGINASPELRRPIATDTLRPSPHLQFDPVDRPTPQPLPDGPLRLGVEDAVLLALQNNRGLRVQQYRPMIVGTFEELERAVYDPRLRAEIAASYSSRTQLDAATGSRFGVDSEQQSGSVGVRQRLPTGTDLGLDLSTTRSDSDRTGTLHSPRVGVTLTQALLRGGSMQANLASIRQAELDTLASEFELRGFAEALIADVERAFWTYALAQREIAIYQSSVDLAERSLSDTQRRVDARALAETALAAPRAEVARRREELINAEAALIQARLRLLRLINPLSADLWTREVHPEMTLVLPDIDLDPVEQHVDAARQMRPELNEARLRLEQGRLQIIQTRDGLLPRLDLFLTLGRTGFADSFGDAIRDVFSGSSYDLSVGLAFEYPLGNRAADASHRRALLSRHQLVESLHNLDQLIELDVRSAWIEVQRVRQQVAATRATLEFRQEALRVERELVEAGRSIPFAVAQAERDLLESQINEARAVVGFRQALINLYRLEGTLLLRRAIEAPGAKLVEDPVTRP